MYKKIKAWAVINEKGKLDYGHSTKKCDIYEFKKDAKKALKFWGFKKDKIAKVEIKILK